MLGTYLIGIFGITGMMIVWVVIQSAWKKVFKDHTVDDDALGDRTKCSNCNCTTVCTKNN